MTKKLFSKINYKTILLPQFYLLNRKIIRNPYIFIPICDFKDALSFQLNNPNVLYFPSLLYAIFTVTLRW